MKFSASIAYESCKTFLLYSVFELFITSAKEVVFHQQ